MSQDEDYNKRKEILPKPTPPPIIKPVPAPKPPR